MDFNQGWQWVTDTTTGIRWMMGDHYIPQFLNLSEHRIFAWTLISSSLLLLAPPCPLCSHQLALPATNRGGLFETKVTSCHYDFAIFQIPSCSPMGLLPQSLPGMSFPCFNHTHTHTTDSPLHFVPALSCATSRGLLLWPHPVAQFLAHLPFLIHPAWSPNHRLLWHLMLAVCADAPWSKYFSVFSLVY